MEEMSSKHKLLDIVDALCSAPDCLLDPHSAICALQYMEPTLPRVLLDWRSGPYCAALASVLTVRDRFAAGKFLWSPEQSARTVELSKPEFRVIERYKGLVYTVGYTIARAACKKPAVYEASVLIGGIYYHLRDRSAYALRGVETRKEIETDLLQKVPFCHGTDPDYIRCAMDCIDFFDQLR